MATERPIKTTIMNDDNNEDGDAMKSVCSLRSLLDRCDFSVPLMAQNNDGATTSEESDSDEMVHGSCSAGYLSIDDTTTIEGSDSDELDDQFFDDSSSSSDGQGSMSIAVNQWRLDLPKSFPDRLMEILDRDDSSHVITWLPDGKSFCILSPKKFTLEVLPQFSQISEFSSFRRKLYWWGFKKISKNEHEHSFYHELFQCRNYSLCRQMRNHKFHGAHRRVKQRRKQQQPPRNNNNRHYSQFKKTTKAHHFRRSSVVQRASRCRQRHLMNQNNDGRNNIRTRMDHPNTTHTKTAELKIHHDI